MSGSGEVTKAGRTLVLCFDGTSNQFDADNTNVVKFFGLLKKDNFNEQLCYYQPGIGTWYEPGVVTPILLWGAKLLDLAFAWYLDAHVIEGYKFIMGNYCAGDKICIFGFSRGAYTARALAGLLHKVGLLPRDNEQQVPLAYKLYKREDKDGLELCAGFKQTFCQDVKVEFLGVWDTVSSVGLIMGRTLPFTGSNYAVKTFRHALSLDEHRAKFRPNYYNRPDPTQAASAAEPEQGIVKGKSFNSEWERLILRPKRPGFFSRLLNKRMTIVLDVKEDGVSTDVLEVWFAGCHGDVGGGAVPDVENHSLSNISLRWMVREIQKANCGIIFDEAALERAQIAASTFPMKSVLNSVAEAAFERAQAAPLSPPLKLMLKDIAASASAEIPDTNALDAEDAKTPIHDELKKNVLWWILEIIPLTYRWQDRDGRWHRSFTPHFGKGREIQDEKPFFHKTVEERMKNAELKYKPGAIWTAGSERYVE